MQNPDFFLKDMNVKRGQFWGCQREREKGQVRVMGSDGIKVDPLHVSTGHSETRLKIP
jgi:hypothetical protein